MLKRTREKLVPVSGCCSVSLARVVLVFHGPTIGRSFSSSRSQGLATWCSVSVVDVHIQQLAGDSVRAEQAAAPMQPTNFSFHFVANGRLR